MISGVSRVWSNMCMYEYAVYVTPAHTFKCGPVLLGGGRGGGRGGTHRISQSNGSCY